MPLGSSVSPREARLRRNRHGTPAAGTLGPGSAVRPLTAAARPRSGALDLYDGCAALVGARRSDPCGLRRESLGIALASDRPGSPPAVWRRRAPRRQPSASGRLEADPEAAQNSMTCVRGTGSTRPWSRPTGNRPELLPSAGGHPLGVPIPSPKIGSTTDSGKTSRANVAAALVACLDAPNTIHQSFGLLDGETAVVDAIGAV